MAGSRKCTLQNVQDAKVIGSNGCRIHQNDSGKSMSKFCTECTCGIEMLDWPPYCGHCNAPAIALGNGQYKISTKYDRCPVRSKLSTCSCGDSNELAN